MPGDPFDDPDRERRSATATRRGRGAGSGFIIDATGNILTNHHVIEGAERITVKLSDGRSLRARVVGIDPDTDIALIKVDAPATAAVAPLGDSDTLRVGEWVCAIGNPLAYEHTVTVGVVSFIGRKLFDTSLDNYIQTDAAINFGNSGGPLINARGEVIGINAAISSRASNIGFAVPINQATADPAAAAARRAACRAATSAWRCATSIPTCSARCGSRPHDGALVQDVTAGSPGERAGLRAYDLIIGGRRRAGGEQRRADPRDRRPRARHDRAAAGACATAGRSDADGASWPSGRAARRGRAPTTASAPRGRRRRRGRRSGLTVRELDASFAHRFDVPRGMHGVVVHARRAAEPGLRRRHRARRTSCSRSTGSPSARSPTIDRADARRARPGDVLAVYRLHARARTHARLTTVRCRRASGAAPSRDHR